MGSEMCIRDRYKPNREVLDMVADRLPVEIDVEAEQIKMWEERTK